MRPGARRAGSQVHGHTDEIDIVSAQIDDAIVRLGECGDLAIGRACCESVDEKQQLIQLNTAAEAIRRYLHRTPPHIAGVRIDDLGHTAQVDHTASQSIDNDV